MRYGRKGFRGKQQSKGWKEFNLKWALENWALSSMHGMFDEIVLQTLTKIEKGGGVYVREWFRLPCCEFWRGHFIKCHCVFIPQQ